MDISCRICGNSKQNTEYQFREMMFGRREFFDYFQCNQCKCIQIFEIPKDMSVHYPDNYMSFNLPLSIESHSFFRAYARKARNAHLVFNRGFFGKLINRFIPHDKLFLLTELGLDADASVLDIGCGNGSLLCELSEIGMKNVRGVDPYIKKDIEYENGVVVEKKEIQQISGTWDLIMMHHVFEHLSNPFDTMKKIHELLDDAGTFLIQIPVVAKAWDVYQEDWVQLDAPRHFFLHTQESMRIIAEKTGFSIERVAYTSNDLQFWGSEQYRRDIPLKDERSYEVNPRNSLFSKQDIDMFKMEAAELNRLEQGDTCAFYLKKV